jgi:Zn-dependent membrane protease YugP
MHPVLILIPAAALVIGPRLWVNQVLKQHNRREEELPCTAAQLARELLDRHRLHEVTVERTDLGDHYDPRARAVRLARDNFDRKSLTALTTAAHEVAHALQHAAGYGPFVWRTRLVKVARVAGEAGFILLLAVPVTALASRRPVPPVVVGTAALSMLGTGVAAQLAALPSELDASFGRALPMLEAEYISAAQVVDARKILLACSLTYIASSLVSILNIWPWLGRPAPAHGALPGAGPVPAAARNPARRADRAHRPGKPARRRARNGIAAVLVRALGKPLIREVLRYTRARAAG